MNAAALSEELVELSVDIFGSLHKNTAVMQYNYGYALLRVKDFERSKSQLSVAVDSYKKVFGRKSKELIDPLMALGKANNKDFKYQGDCVGKRYFVDAIKISKKWKFPKVFEAELNYEAGMSCIDYFGFKDGRKFLGNARSIFVDKLVDHDKRRVLTDFYLGKALLALGKRNQ